MGLVVCCGWKDENGITHECGKELGNKPGTKYISHGYCPECERKARQVLAEEIRRIVEHAKNHCL